MSSIEDFVNHRWADAKEALRKLDEKFVGELETAVRLNRLGLSAASQHEVKSVPQQCLSTEWHRLLESCTELVMQMSVLQAAAVCLTADANRETELVQAGKMADYHFRSWFVHVNTLAERANSVIEWTIEVYVDNEHEGTKLAKEMKARVYREMTEPFKDTRNSNVHGSRRSWAGGITEDLLWEGMVAIGMTPQLQLEEFHHPTEGRRLKSGKHNYFVNETETICNSLGSILLEFEDHLSKEFHRNSSSD